MDLHDWIHPDYLNPKNILKLRGELLAKEHVKIIALENFLNEEKKNLLAQELVSCQKQYLRKEVYADGTLNIDFYSYTWKIILELKEFFHSESFLKYLSLFYGYKLGFTYDMETINSYTNGGTLVQTFTEENHLNWHDDRDDAGMILYYLNHDWTPSKWGELELGYTNDIWEYICYDSITPEFNKLVILIPKIGTYHRVSPIKEGYLRKWLVEHLSFQK